MASRVATCQFCGKDGPHPNAHILPRALYRGELGIAFKSIKASGTEPVRRSQIGVYDSELWCQSCEHSSSELDTYAAEHLLKADKLAQPYRDKNGNPWTLPDGRSLRTLEQVDPFRLHLFVLSVLWRASASRQREVAHFTLGSHQNRIKALLQSRNVDALKDYGYLLRHEREEDLRGGLPLPGTLKV